MNPTVLLALHLVLFTAVPIALAAWRAALSRSLLYAYLAVLLFLGGFLGGLYALPIGGSVVLSGGSVVYGAFMFTVIVLIVSARDIQVIRDVVLVVVVVNLFKLVFFFLAARSLDATGTVNRFDTAPDLFDTSVRVVLVGGTLIIAELILMVSVFERIKSLRKLASAGSVAYIFTFVAVVTLDGVLFPIINSPTADDLATQVLDGLQSKLVLALCFAVPLALFLILFRDRVALYEAESLDLAGLFRAPDPALVREIERQKQVLEYQARHDGMTGLVNRAELVSLIDTSIQRGRSRPGTEIMAVVCIDIDDFKLVNDGHGHPVGDGVLVAVAARIQAGLGDADAAARLGGDEFAVLSTELSGDDEAVDMANRILAAVHEPVHVDGIWVSPRASAGVAWTSALDPILPEHLVRNANLAMYRAKELGKDRLEIFDTHLEDQARTRAELFTQIERAIAEDEFTIHYQPIVELATGRLAGLEALARWNHPERGLLGPDAFIGRAEESQSIVALGALILDRVCRECVDWTTRDGSPIPVSVNVATRQLREGDLVAHVTSSLAASGLRPGRLSLEITETDLAVDLHGSVRVLEELRALGVKIAIDDFGTGFSSLAYLHQLPADTLKIDKTFVDRIHEPASATGRSLAESIVGLGALLSMSVVAEGIETSQQCRILRDLGCDYGQGYYFAPAMSASGVVEMLAAVNGRFRPWPDPY